MYSRWWSVLNHNVASFMYVVYWYIKTTVGCYPNNGIMVAPIHGVVQPLTMDTLKQRSAMRTPHVLLPSTMAF